MSLDRYDKDFEQLLNGIDEDTLGKLKTLTLKCYNNKIPQYFKMQGSRILKKMDRCKRRLLLDYIWVTCIRGVRMEAKRKRFNLPNITYSIMLHDSRDLVKG